MEYARKLKVVIDNNWPIVYFDESSVNSWLVPTKCWGRDGSRNAIISDPRTKKSVFAAIGSGMVAPLIKCYDNS